MANRFKKKKMFLIQIKNCVFVRYNLNNKINNI